eukprot:m.93253 g.93253  ORF g.93253 m.93253 type:complete len:53 (+) comp13395_c1_seq3:236-394(+)
MFSVCECSFHFAKEVGLRRRRTFSRVWRLGVSVGNFVLKYEDNKENLCNQIS